MASATPDRSGAWPVVHSLTGTAEPEIRTFWSTKGHFAMSRCFPYPRPGYEKNARNDAKSDHVDLLAKGKHKEKKNKKQKRDKEKREGKKRKGKDRSKDKYKEKKDQKGKQKEKKKEKDKDKGKDKGRSQTSEDKTDKQIRSHHEDRLEGSWKTGGIKYSKFPDELDHRIKHEEKVTSNRMVDNFTSSFQRRSSDGSGSEAAKVMERVASNKAIPVSMDSLPRRIHGMARPADKFPSSIQNHTEVLGSANAVQKERNTSDNVSNLTRLGKIGNGGKEQPVDNSRVTIRQRSDGPYSTTAVEKENCKYDKVLSNPNNTIHRPFNGMGRSAESDGIGLAKTIEYRGEIKKVVPSHIITEQRKEDGIGQLVEKDAEKRIKEKEKNREGEGNGRKEEGHKEIDHNKKKKDKDKLHKKEKEQAKAREKGQQKHKEYDEIRGIGNKDQIDSPNLKLLTSREKNNNSDENKKRKGLAMNGFLHENDSLPNKLQRTSSSHLVENGRVADLSHVACSSTKPEAISNIKAGKLLADIKEHIVNGIRVARPSSDGLQHPAVVDDAKCQVSLKPPHPDSKHLTVIYSVPKMDDLPGCDDQEWLSSSCHLHSKPKSKLDADETPQVWAEAQRIDSEGVLALPYVIPF